MSEKMPAATLEALKGSIEKWEKIVAGNGEDKGPANCPLCQMFNVTTMTTINRCIGCPVYQITGKRYCSGTPYDVFAKAKEKNDNADDESEIIPLTPLAQAELNFLRSLLPAEE